MSFPGRPFLATSLLLATVGVAHARCGDDPGDVQAVADARAEVATECDCDGAPDHRTYVACAARIAKQRATSGMLPPSCKGAVKRCARRSTCGRPGSVPCCIERKGTLACRIVGDAASCSERGGCAGGAVSCCEACVPFCTPTTSTMPPINPCAGQCSCPPGQECADVRVGCACAPAPACGPVGASCGGNCPPGTGEPCHLDTFNGHCTCGCIGPGGPCTGPGQCCPPSFTCTAGFCE